MPDVTQVLMQQHRKVESLFELYETTASPEQRGEIVREIVENLSRHSAVEEMTVYPEIADDVGGAEADSLRHEHQELKEVLARIEDLEPTDTEYAARVMEAKQLVQTHVDEEENQVFPRFRQALPQDRLDELGDGSGEAGSGLQCRIRRSAPS